MQLPAVEQATEVTEAASPWFRMPLPGTILACRQVPPTSFTTNACVWPGLVEYIPPAAQLPGEGHDKDTIAASLPVLRPAVPGTSTGLRQVPFTSSATNACRSSTASL